MNLRMKRVLRGYGVLGGTKWKGVMMQIYLNLKLVLINHYHKWEIFLKNARTKLLLLLHEMLYSAYIRLRLFYCYFLSDILKIMNTLESCPMLFCFNI